MSLHSPSGPRRPLVGVALTWALGLGVAYLWPIIPIGKTIAIATCCLLLTALAAHRSRIASLLAHLAVVLTSLTHGLVSQPGRRADDLRGWWKEPASYFELMLRISSVPVEYEANDTSQGGWRWRGVVEAVRADQAQWCSASGDVEGWLPATPGCPVPAYGDRWYVGGVVRQGKGGELQLSVRGPAHLVARNTGSRWLSWCYAQREKARTALQRGIEDWSGPVDIIPAMVLGYRDDVALELRERFLRTGTAHVFAISGLHVGIFSVVLAGAVRMFGCPRRWWGLALVPLLALYTVATGASVSAVRAFVIASIWWLAPAVQRRPDLPCALAAAALLILGCAPSQIAEAGFWYSFLVVIGLITLTPSLEVGAGILARGTEPAPDSDVGPHRWLIAQGFSHRIVRLAAASVAAWVASTPLTMFTGNQIAPAALPGNLLVIPAAFLIVLTGCLSLVSGLFSTWIAVTLNHANAAICAVLVRAVDALYAMPGSHFAVIAPPLGAVVLFYAATAALRVLEGRARIALLTSATLVAGCGLIRYLSDDRARIVLAPPHLAPAMLLDVPGEHGDWLIDPGPAWTAPQLLRWLRSRGVDRLDAIVLTVLDAHHAGATPSVLARIPTRRILVPSGRVSSPVVRYLLATVAQEGHEIVPLAEGDEGVLPGSVVWDVWHPGRGTSYMKAADGALWLRIARGATAVLLAGPASRAQISSLDRIRFDPAATVIVVERPLTSKDTSWLHVLGPRRVIEHHRAIGSSQKATAVLRLPAG